MFSPKMGTWMQRDPAEEGLDLYAYTGDNPVNKLDPLGLQQTGTQPSQPATQPATLPAPVKGTKKTESGTYEWSLSVFEDETGFPEVQFRMVFEPDKDKCKTTHLAIIQVVLEFSLDGKVRYPNNDEEYFKQFASKAGSYVDHEKGETDPYYNAILKNKEWVSSSAASHLGNGPNGKAASIFDQPSCIAGRIGKFEAIVVDMKSQTACGGVKWGYKSTSTGTPGAEMGLDHKIHVINPPRISDLTATFVETPSDEWRSAVAKWNEVAKKHEDWSQYPLK